MGERNQLFLFLKKPLYEVKAIGPQLSFNIFQQPETYQTKKKKKKEKKKLYKTLDY